MSQQSKFIGVSQNTPPNYNMNHMNHMNTQQQIPSPNPALINQLKPQFNPANSNPYAQVQPHQQRPPQSSFPPQPRPQQTIRSYQPRQNPSPLTPQQMQYQQRLMVQQRLLNSPNPAYNNPMRTQAQSQPRTHNAQSTNMNALNMNAMSPQQRQQYIMAQQRQHFQPQILTPRTPKTPKTPNTNMNKPFPIQSNLPKMNNTFPTNNANNINNFQSNVPNMNRNNRNPMQNNMNANARFQNAQMPQTQSQTQPQMPQMQTQTQPRMAQNNMNANARFKNAQMPQMQTQTFTSANPMNAMPSAIDTAQTNTNTPNIPMTNPNPYNPVHRAQYPVLPNRKYVDVSTPQSKDPLREIRVVSFNVMPKNAYLKNKLQKNDGLQGYITRPNYYSWNKRGPLVIEELRKACADIICLQGCDQFAYFQETLAPKGFVGVYEHTQQPLLLQKTVYFGDGLAIFWRTEKFELVGREKHLLGDRRYVSNIALLARLKRRSPFINPLPINKNCIVCQSRIKYRSNGQNSAFYGVLSNNKYLYLYPDQNAFVNNQNAFKYFDLDLYKQIGKATNDFGFELRLKREGKTVEYFECSETNLCMEWRKYILKSQIGIEIDVWNTHLIDGCNINGEYERVKQSKLLFECIAKTSKAKTLKNKNIGATHYNPHFNPYKDVSYEKKEFEKDDSKDLSLLFKKLMEARINGDTTVTIPKKEEIIPSIEREPRQEEMVPKTDKSLDIPTQLYRPVIVCIDIAGNALPDYLYNIPPLCYTYLTMRSRTTQTNALYQNALKQIRMKEKDESKKHLWFLQSSYALGFQSEPEFTSFKRYWPADTNAKMSDFKNTKNLKLNFSESIEIAKCSDLILFSPQHFRVLKLFEAINKKWIYTKWNKTLPNMDYPSDHTMIAVQFELAIPIETQQKRTPNIAMPTSMNRNPAMTAVTPNMINNVNINGKNAPSISIATSALPTAQINYTPQYSPFNNNSNNIQFQNNSNSSLRFQNNGSNSSLQQFQQK